MAKQFSIFTKGKSGGIDLSSHFEKWGWISFLTYVTEKSIFDISGNGKSKLQNTKETKLYDVLVWADERSDYESAIAAYQEQLYKK